MAEKIDTEFVGAIMKSVMSANPIELVKMMSGAKIDFESSFDDVPLEIGIRIRDDEILVRVKILKDEVETENGDQSRTD